MVVGPRMATKAAFGKRGLATPAAVRAPAPARPVPAHAAPTAPAPDSSALEVFHEHHIPVLTIGLVVLLCVIFAVEIRYTRDFISAMSPSAPSLTAMGGVEGKLVFQGEWWRLLTAPLLHGSLSHLIGNCVALLLAGFFLEPLVGGAWFLALFALAALGGAAGSLAQNDPNIVSVGASGAIMGVMSLSFLLASRQPDPKRARRARLLALRMGIPAILPAFLAGGGTDHVDYGAHIGGFLTGGVLWMLLGLIWPGNEARPPLRKAMALLAGAIGLGGIAAFAMAVAGPAPAAPTGPGAMIPAKEMPDTDADMDAKSAMLVTRYPDDPRAHYLRAIHFLGQHDTSDAAEQLRAGLAVLPPHVNEVSPMLGHIMKAELALIVARQGDRAAARAIVEETCAAPEAAEIRARLAAHDLCPRAR